MKANKLFLWLMLCIGSICTINAQTDMVWDIHGVGFSVPDNFEISENNAEEFTADNGDLFLSILPIQDKTITDDDLYEVVVEMANELDYDRIQDGDAVDIDDFTGYYVRGRKDGTTAIVMALLDRESSTNLLVVIVHNDGAEDEALAIANSFYAYD